MLVHMVVCVNVHLMFPSPSIPIDLLHEFHSDNLDQATKIHAVSVIVLSHSHVKLAVANLTFILKTTL